MERLCAEVGAERAVDGLWLVGKEGSGKSALCAYIAQRLYPTNHAVVERVGDLLAHLRWLGAVKGELAVERRLEQLINTPLLVLDGVDRATRSHGGAVPLAFKNSCASHDLLRFAWLLRERHAAMRPFVLTSRAEPANCAASLSAITPEDLMRGLVATAQGSGDPFEEFPAYTAALLEGAFEQVRNRAVRCSLEGGYGLALAA